MWSIPYHLELRAARQEKSRQLKRCADHSQRQEKRRKLIEEGEWEISEGCDVYGDRDERYNKLLEALEKWELHETCSARVAR